MIFFVRTTVGLGNSEVYVRLRDSLGRYWNFSTLLWNVSESSNTKKFMTEYTDSDIEESLYQTIDTSIPAGGPWRQEAVLESTGEVIGYDNTAVIVDNDILNNSVVTPISNLVKRLIRSQYFAYVGDVNQKTLVNGVQKGAIAVAIQTNPAKIYLNTGRPPSFSDYTTYFDFIFVRNYRETEPVWGAWGNQETSQINQIIIIA